MTIQRWMKKQEVAGKPYPWLHNSRSDMVVARLSWIWIWMKIDRFRNHNRFGNVASEIRGFHFHRRGEQNLLDLFSVRT